MEWPENKYRQTKFGNDLIVPSSSETSINVPELIDAENAGRNDARNCTLVLTEGESAKKKFTLSGFEVMGNRIGVYILSEAKC